MTPPPGSPAAVAMGCICAIRDNARGLGSGYRDDAGQPLYWITTGCPVHTDEGGEEHGT